MARRCELTGKAVLTGNNVSHANNRTKRRFLPNLHHHRIWVESEKRFAGINPANGIRFADIHEATRGMVDEAVEAGHRAVQAWGKTSVVDRAAMLCSIADEIDRRADDFLDAEVSDTGKGLDSRATPLEGKGFGLRQIRERLATLYGTESAIKLVACSAGGTRASITFPLKT